MENYLKQGALHAALQYRDHLSVRDAKLNRHCVEGRGSTLQNECERLLCTSSSQPQVAAPIRVAGKFYGELDSCEEIKICVQIQTE
jgi:hypothetical protein